MTKFVLPVLAAFFRTPSLHFHGVAVFCTIPAVLPQLLYLIPRFYRGYCEFSVVPIPLQLCTGSDPKEKGGRYCNCKQYRLLLANIILQRYYVHQRDGKAYADRVDLSLVSLCPYVCPSY